LIVSGVCVGTITIKKFFGGSFTMHCPQQRVFIAMTSAHVALSPLIVHTISGLALWQRLFWLPLLPACPVCLYWLDLTFGLAPPLLANIPVPGL
jgi:hypothetical protein